MCVPALLSPRVCRPEGSTIQTNCHPFKFHQLPPFQTNCHQAVAVAGNKAAVERLGRQLRGVVEPQQASSEGVQRLEGQAVRARRDLDKVRSVAQSLRNSTAQLLCNSTA